MLEYNKDKNILYAFYNQASRPILEVDTSNSSTYRSFQNYIKDRLPQDIEEVFMPALRDVIKCSEEDLYVRPGSVKCGRVTTSRDGVRDFSYHAQVEFGVSRFDGMFANGRRPLATGDTHSISICCMPRVLENGIIEHEDKKYSLIHMLEQEPTISYEANETNHNPTSFKLKTGSRSIYIDDDNRSLKIRLSDRSGKSSKIRYTLINLIMAMAKNEGYDRYALWDEFASFNIINMFGKEEDKIRCIEYFGQNSGQVNAIDYTEELVPRLTLSKITNTGKVNTSYDNTEIRGSLNRLLSLDRAIGCKLARDVYSQLNPERKLASKGDLVDQYLVSLFNSEGVYKIYVKKIPSVEGYFLMDRIIFNYAPKGMKITEELRECFPEEDGMYVSKNYDKLAVPIIYEEGTPITMDILNIIDAFNEDTIIVSDKKSGGANKILNFYEEIISNRQFLGDDIGRESGTWYYLNKDNEFVENNGSYTTYDFVALQSFCIRLFEGDYIDRVTNSDTGFRKTLIPLEEQYHRAFCYAVRECMKQMGRKYKTIWNKDQQAFLSADAIDNEFYPMTKKFWEYLRDEAKCLMNLSGDNLHNPISYQSACTKVNVYTPSKHSVSDKQREIAIGSYGKLDPYEIPQSHKMGVVYNNTCGVRIADDGTMSTPYYRVIRGANNTSKIDFSTVEYLTSEQEESHCIADIGSIDFDENGVIHDNTKMVQCRVPSTSAVEKQTFSRRRIADIDRVNVSATQSLSWTSACIPFMGSNDAARAIFADSQVKQAKGLVNAEEPDVMTSAYEQFVWLNDQYGIIAKRDGFVQSITVGSGKNTANTDSSICVIYAENPNNDPALTTRLEADPTVDKEIFYFNEYFDSGYSVTKMKVLVEPGQHFKRGDMLVCSNFISERGILTFGINALTGFICDGFNYEDGSHQSSKLGERLASYRFNRDEFTGSAVNTAGYYIEKIPRVEYLSKDDGKCLSVSYRDVRSKEFERKSYGLEKSYGFVENWSPIRAEHSKSNYGAELTLVSVDRSNRGDKVSNRHGNKGTISKIEDPANMPRLQNGMPLEICNNPLGVGSRMNIGQINDAHCGLIAHVLCTHISADAFNSISEEEITTLLSLTVDLMNSDDGNLESIINSYKGIVPDNFLDHCRENINRIRIYRGCFNKRGTTKLILPDNNGRMTETEVLIGYVYTFKLIQESYMKAHARGGETQGEPYAEVSNAPTHGSSAQGGQKFGGMEMDALMAYGVSNYIQELTNERCDNAIARTNMYADIYLPHYLRKSFKEEDKGQRRSVTQFLYSMLALGVVAEPQDGEFLPLDKDNGTDLSHWKVNTLRRASSKYLNDGSYAEVEEEEENVEVDVEQEQGFMGLIKSMNTAGIVSEDKKVKSSVSARDLIMGLTSKK